MFAAALAALSGCHLLLPLGPSSDGTPLLSDGPQTTEQPGKIDATVTPLCTDTPPLSAEKAACACLSGEEGDCDGLPDNRDPEPNSCNELLYEETFLTDPLTPRRWATRNCKWSWTCGWLHQHSVDNPESGTAYCWARALDAALTTRSYLVETRVRLEAVASMTDWDMAVVGRLSGAVTGADTIPDEFMTCAARMDSKDLCYGCSPQRRIENPDCKVETRNALDWQGSWPLENPLNLYDPAPGQVYLLQLWFQGGQKPQLMCMLSDSAGKPRRLAYHQMWGPFDGDTKYLPTGAGTVGLRTWDRGASVDYVRVFALHEQGPL